MENLSKYFIVDVNLTLSTKVDKRSGHIYDLLIINCGKNNKTIVIYENNWFNFRMNCLPVGQNVSFGNNKPFISNNAMNPRTCCWTKKHETILRIKQT